MANTQPIEKRGDNPTSNNAESSPVKIDLAQSVAKHDDNPISDHAESRAVNIDADALRSAAGHPDETLTGGERLQKRGFFDEILGGLDRLDSDIAAGNFQMINNQGVSHGDGNGGIYWSGGNAITPYSGHSMDFTVGKVRVRMVSPEKMTQKVLFEGRMVMVNDVVVLYDSGAVSRTMSYQKTATAFWHTNLPLWPVGGVAMTPEDIQNFEEEFSNARKATSEVAGAAVGAARKVVRRANEALEGFPFGPLSSPPRVTAGRRRPVTMASVTMSRRRHRGGRGGFFFGLMHLWHIEGW